MPPHARCRTSPASESRIPKPRATIARGTTRSLEEGSVRSGSSSTEDSAGKFRKRAGSGSKKPVEDLERGWVGSGLEPPDDTTDLAAELAGTPRGKLCCWVLPQCCRSSNCATASMPSVPHRGGSGGGSSAV